MSWEGLGGEVLGGRSWERGLGKVLGGSWERDLAELILQEITFQDLEPDALLIGDDQYREAMNKKRYSWATHCRQDNCWSSTQCNLASQDFLLRWNLLDPTHHRQQGFQRSGNDPNHHQQPHHQHLYHHHRHLIATCTPCNISNNDSEQAGGSIIHHVHHHIVTVLILDRLEDL